MSELLPEPALPTPVPSAWEPCPLCGALTPLPDLHRDWHQQVVDRIRAAEDRLGVVESRRVP